MANLYRRLDDFEKARKHYESALSIQREIGNLPSAAVVRGIWGVTPRSGDLDEAESHIVQAIEIGDQA